jgi:hypothetical protein
MISEVAAGSQEVKVESDATISCTISGLRATATVEWVDSSGTAVSGSNFTPTPGSSNAGTQTSKLLVKGAATKTDKSYTCRIKSGAITTSPSSDTTVALNIYGEIKDLSVKIYIVYL